MRCSLFFWAPSLSSPFLSSTSSAQPSSPMKIPPFHLKPCHEYLPRPSFQLQASISSWSLGLIHNSSEVGDFLEVHSVFQARLWDPWGQGPRFTFLSVCTTSSIGRDAQKAFRKHKGHFNHKLCLASWASRPWVCIYKPRSQEKCCSIVLTTALLTQPSLFSCLEGAEQGEQAKCAELFDISAAVQNAHLFSLPCTRFAPHHSFFLCWVSLVTSVLLLFLQEVTEPGSVNSSGVSSPRERRGQGLPFFWRGLVSAGMKGRPITREFPDQRCGFLCEKVRDLSVASEPSAMDLSKDLIPVPLWPPIVMWP